MATLTQLQSWLSEAQSAFHDLQVGKAAVRFRDQSGEDITYTPANSDKLAAYIRSLEVQIANFNSPRSSSVAPLRVTF